MRSLSKFEEPNIKFGLSLICTFDLFNKGRHKYTFQNVCLEDNSIMLNDEAHKIILNSKGIMNDLSDELLEFLAYVEDSSDDTVKYAKGNIVKNIHRRVKEVKSDILMEVEFMTLLERDREKIEEGIEKGREEGILLTKKVLKLSNSGYTISQIAKECNISEEEVRRILE
ncbi:hypothetical protein CLOBL_53150 [Clostridium sp. BL-8]|nr:hypothetical protein CLOBL_53150 [Clostridium sp. BL-8]